MPDEELDNRSENVASLSLLVIGLGSLTLFAVLELWSKREKNEVRRPRYLPPNARSGITGGALQEGTALTSALAYVTVTPKDGIPVTGNDALELSATARYKDDCSGKYKAMPLVPSVNNGVITSGSDQSITFAINIEDTWRNLRVVITGVEDNGDLYTASIVHKTNLTPSC